MSKRLRFAFPCAVSWCCALAQWDGAFCQPHAKRPDLHPSADPNGALAAVAECGWCHSTGECASCDGTGEHECDHSGCSDVHRCGSCGGSGNCDVCKRKVSRTALEKWESEYLAFAFDAGLTILSERPWEEIQ